MTTVDIKKIKTEWINFLRNSDIFTVSQRGVTTDTDVGTFSSDTEHLINVSNIKNIRSVVVASITLTYGKDYDFNLDYDDSGTIKCRITFNSSQTGAYTITYDYGASDKIFPDFPRPDLTISSFPRIGSDILDIRTIDAGFGGVLGNDIRVTTVVYDERTDNIADYLTAIRAAVFASKNNFYYIGKYVKPISNGPVLPSPRVVGKDRIMQQNIDIEGRFFYEK